jgi:hypothetical protein
MNHEDFLNGESQRSTVNGQPSPADRRPSTVDQFEEPLDETLLAHARSYHEPGAVPREEMWRAIRDGRDGQDGRDGRVIPFRRAIRVALPIAAVLAVGIFVGRMTIVDGQRSTVHGQRPTVDSPATPSISTVPSSDQSDQVATTTLSEDSLTPDARRPTPVDRRPSTVDAGRSTLDSRPATAFSVAAERHFAQAETFLTLFRTSVREGKDESLAPATARELLVSNRLLMDSPAADDPRVSRLLDDIELVLAQIAQLPVEGKQADAEIITDGLEAGGILTRIRTEVTSGPVAAVPQGAL